MRKTNLLLPLVALVAVAVATPAVARTFGSSSSAKSGATAKAPAKVINCEVVRKDLKMGQWPADIALQQGITLQDVKSCEGGKPAPPGQQKGGPQKKGTPASGA